MKPTVYIKTPMGLEYYSAVQHEFFAAKAKDTLDEFRKTCLKERFKVEADLEFLLDDPEVCKMHKMDSEDEMGWQLYHEMSDRFSTLNHFSNRMK
jgi:hypothetical protein